jgi:hypothetical protein
MNEKSQATQERLYSEKKKRGRALGIMKEAAAWQKTTEELSQQRKVSSSSQPIPSFLGG